MTKQAIATFLRKWFHIFGNVIPLVILIANDILSTIHATPDLMALVPPKYFVVAFQVVILLNVIRGVLKKYEKEIDGALQDEEK